MPPRSTLVQRVVFHIQRQLAAGATITESAMLPDRSGTGAREVDVAIRTRVGGHEVVISVECREGRRKATVGWVEEMVMKLPFRHPS